MSRQRSLLVAVTVAALVGDAQPSRANSPSSTSTSPDSKLNLVPFEALIESQAGLAMADANQGPAGIVTAREIAGFDWRGMQLVVLSTCQTGLGAVASGDGIDGLRPALVLANAASQEVSLWSVADASTPALMRDYYAALEQGTGKAEALRETKWRLLQQPGYTHPFY